MRQNRRGRVWHIGILFLIYSCLYVYSAKIKTSTEEEINEEQTGSLNELNVSPNPTFDTELYTTSIAKEVHLYTQITWDNSEKKLAKIVIVSPPGD